MGSEWSKVEYTHVSKDKNTGEVTSTTWYGDDEWGFTATSKTKSLTPKKSNAVVGPVTPNKQGLDKVVKQLPGGTGSSAQDLQNLATGNIKIDLIGGISGKINKWLGQPENDKAAENAKMATVPALSGNGVSGGFNPAGKPVKKGELPTPTSDSLVKLAKPIFTSGTSVESATVDIYDGINHGPQNKIKSVLSNVLGIVNNSVAGSLGKMLAESSKKMGILSKMTSLKSAESVLDQMKGSILSGVPLTKDSVNKILLDTVGYDGKSLSFKGGIKGLRDTMMADITKNLDTHTGILTVYSGVRTIINGDLDTAEGIFKIMENITGNEQLGKFLDMTHTMAIFSTVTQSLLNLGAPQFFDKLIEKIDHKDRDKYFADNLEAGLFSGDIGFMESVLRYRSGGWVMSSQPNAINMLVMSFRPPTDEFGEITPDAYARLTAVLNQLEVNWDIVDNRGGFKRYNTKLFSQFNAQAKLAIAISGRRDHIVALLMSENFGTDYNIKNEVANRYPEYPI